MKRIALTALLGAMFAAPVVSDAAPLDHWTTANGARVYYVPSHEIGMVDISVEFDAGSRHNPPGKSALAALVNAQLDKGIGALGNVPAMNEAELLDAFADAAAVRSCENGADSAGCSVRFLSDAKTRDTVVPLMAAVLAKPAFPSDVLARDKKRYESGIRESLSRVETVVSRAYKKAVYGDHPYGRSVNPDDVASVSASELADFHKRHYTAGTAVVSIVGDISREDAVKAAETLTKDLPIANDSNVPLVPVPRTTAKLLDIFHDSEQSHVRIGLASLKRGDKDFFAVLVGNQVLGGGGFTSRLMKEIREKRAMSYHVGSVFSPMKEEGPFTVVLQTKNDQAKEAADAAKKLVADFLRDGPTKHELELAKEHLIRSFPMRLDGNGKRLAIISTIGFYGLSDDYLDTWCDNVKKVTVEDVKAAMNRKIDMDRLVTVIAGGAKTPDGQSGPSKQDAADGR